MTEVVGGIDKGGECGRRLDLHCHVRLVFVRSEFDVTAEFRIACRRTSCRRLVRKERPVAGSRLRFGFANRTRCELMSGRCTCISRRITFTDTLGLYFWDSEFVVLDDRVVVLQSIQSYCMEPRGFRIFFVIILIQSEADCRVKTNVELQLHRFHWIRVRY